MGRISLLNMRGVTGLWLCFFKIMLVHKNNFVQDEVHIGWDWVLFVSVGYM